MSPGDVRNVGRRRGVRLRIASDRVNGAASLDRMGWQVPPMPRLGIS